MTLAHQPKTAKLCPAEWFQEMEATGVLGQPPSRDAWEEYPVPLCWSPTCCGTSDSSAMGADISTFWFSALTRHPRVPFAPTALSLHPELAPYPSTRRGLLASLSPTFILTSPWLLISPTALFIFKDMGMGPQRPTDGQHSFLTL